MISLIFVGRREDLLRNILFGLVILFCGLAIELKAQICPAGSYRWPVIPGGEAQQRINSTFMEYRSGHFHDGIDIHCPEDSSVIACSNNIVAFQINPGTYEHTDGSIHQDSSVYVREIDSPFRTFLYDHLKSTATGLKSGDVLNNAGDEIGKTNIRNHLHFNEGPDDMEVHPLRDGESLCRFVDSAEPTIHSFRVHKEGQHGNNAQVPKEGNLYYATGRVDFLVRASDAISGPGGSNTGLFGVEYEIYDSTLTRLARNTIYFDTTWVPNSYLKFVYDTTLSIISNQSKYWYIPTNKLTSNGYWDSQTVADGIYNLCFWAADAQFNYHDTCYTIKVANHPTPPVIQGAIGSVEQVELTIRGVGATSYRIYYDTDSGPPYQGTGANQGASPIEIVLDSTLTKTVTLTGLTTGVTYYFAVKGYNSNSNEESNYSLEVSATPVNSPPPTPTNLVASRNSAGFVQLVWQDNGSSSAAATGFKIFRSQTSGSGFTEINNVTTESFTDYTVLPAVTYYYKVQAYNGVGSSALTSQVSRLAGLSGNLTGNLTWSPPGAILAGAVTIPDGSSLTVQAGATVKAAPIVGLVLKVFGALNVTGTQQAPVLFDRSDTTGVWNGIRYFSGSGGAITWAIIRNAKKCVWVDYVDTIVLDHCTISDFTEQGVYLFESASTIKNSTITNSAGGTQAIYANGVGNSQILNNVISNAPVGIRRVGNAGTGWITINGNDISNCSNAGILIANAGGEAFNNYIHHCLYGIRLQTGAHPEIHDNDLYANKNGLFLEGAEPTELKWNNFGYTAGALNPNTGANIRIDTLSAANNFMAQKWNNFYNGAALDISNNTTMTLIATGQYWNAQALNGPIDVSLPKVSHNANAGPTGSTGKTVSSGQEALAQIPDDYVVEQNYPNPFNPSTKIRFAVPQRARLTLTIYDLTGQIVRELIPERAYDKGWVEMTWDATNDNGMPVGSGVYFYRLSALGLENQKRFEKTRRLVLMR